MCTQFPDVLNIHTIIGYRHLFAVHTEPVYQLLLSLLRHREIMVRERFRHKRLQLIVHIARMVNLHTPDVLQTERRNQTGQHTPFQVQIQAALIIFCEFLQRFSQALENAKNAHLGVFLHQQNVDTIFLCPLSFFHNILIAFSIEIYDINLPAIPCRCLTQISDHATNTTTRHVVVLVNMYIFHIIDLVYSFTLRPF